MSIIVFFATLLQRDEIEQGMAYNEHNSIGMVSIILYIFALLINGTIGIKTGKKTSDKYSLVITPPSWAFSIWGLIFTSTFLALLWAFYSVSWSPRTHMYFWAYCIVISVWIIFWAWASFLAVVIAKFLLIVLTIILFEVWRSTLKLDDQGLGASFMRLSLAFQLGWCASAQCLNICIFLVYGPLKLSQVQISKLIWILLIFSHGVYSYLAHVQTQTHEKSYLLSFVTYFFSMSWAIWGVYTSYSSFKLLKDNKKI